MENSENYNIEDEIHNNESQGSCFFCENTSTESRVLNIKNIIIDLLLVITKSFSILS